jgi:hypothetical protein
MHNQSIGAAEVGEAALLHDGEGLKRIMLSNYDLLPPPLDSLDVLWFP